MGRHSCCVKQKLRKGLWSPEEDEKLYNHITRFGVGCWSSVPKLAGLQRCGKSCRLRWINYLRPDLKRGMFTEEEEDLIISLHKVLGNRWAQIATHLPGRTDNEIKNFWNSCIKKKLIKRGIDPNTHLPAPEFPVKKETDCTESSSLQILQRNVFPNLSNPIKDYIVGESSVYDNPIFLPEFESNSGWFRPYEERDLVTGNPIITSGNGFSSLPNLTSFDQSDYSDSPSSRISAFLINEVNKNMIENGNLFSWDSDHSSMFQFQFNGIQIEDRKDTVHNSSDLCQLTGDIFQHL